MRDSRSEEPQVLCQLLIPKSLESSLADMARSQRTTVNQVIHEVLSERVKRQNSATAQGAPHATASGY